MIAIQPRFIGFSQKLFHDLAAPFFSGAPGRGSCTSLWGLAGRVDDVRIARLRGIGFEHIERYLIEPKGQARQRATRKK
jgi:hypothetical protein